MKRWTIFVALFLSWTPATPLSAQGWEPPGPLGDIEILGFSSVGASGEFVRVHFKSVAHVDDISKCDWNFGASCGTGIVSQSFPLGTHQIRLAMRSDLSGPIVVDKEISITSNDLVIQDDFDDLSSTSANWFSPSCNPEFITTVGTFLKFDPCSDQEPAFSGDKVSGDLICLGPGGGPGIDPPPQVTLDSDETAASIRLKFNIDLLELDDGAAFDLLTLYKHLDNGSTQDIARLEIWRQGVDYQVSLSTLVEGAQPFSNLGALGPAPGDTTLVLHWLAGQPEQLNGAMQASFWFESASVDGPPSLEIALDGLDNSAVAFDHLRMGLDNIRPGISIDSPPIAGYLLLEEIEMRRENPVGPFS